jgi:hypothetical protein
MADEPPGARITCDPGYHFVDLGDGSFALAPDGLDEADMSQLRKQPTWRCACYGGRGGGTCRVIVLSPRDLTLSK